MPLNESVARRKQREDEERRKRERAVEIARGGSNNSATSPQTSRNYNPTNSSAYSQNSSYGSQTGSQTVSQPSTPAERDLFKITGRRHTVTDRRRGIDKNEKTQRTGYISGQNRGLSRDDNDRFTNTVKGAGKQWLGGQLSGLGTIAQADIVNINSIRGARAENDNDYRLTSREEAEKREAESVNKSRTKDGVNLRNMERRYSLDPVGNVSDNYGKIVRGTQKIINKGDSLIESGTQDIEKAKEGANDFEKFLIDSGAQFTQWAGDASLRMIPIVGQALSMGGFFNRAGGMSAYQGRQEGMNPDQQFKYYAGSGLMEALSELTFQSVGALRATYGKGMFSIADKLTTKASTSGIVRRLLNNTELGKSLFINMARLGGNAVEEGLEEVETDLVDPLLKYFIKKSEDPRAEFEGWDFPQMGYDFLMGATMGGVLGVAEVPNRVKYELNIANSDAFNDGMTTSLIKQASVQGRQSDGGRLIPTNAEILAQQLQQQMDNNIPVQPAQIRMLQEAIGQSISENQKQLTRRMTEEYDKAQKSGDLVQMEGTRLESQGIDNASVKLYDDATEKARQVLGEDATQEEVEAVAGVTTGLASTNEIDTVLVKPELKKAVETIVNEGADAESAVSIPVNNAEARDTLENLTAVKRIANRNTILKDVQAKNAEIIKSSVDNMSEGGKNLFASRAELAQDTIGGNRDRNLEIYRDRFSRLYTDGNTKGADFETSYKRIIGSLDSEALKSVFTEDFARQIFEEGRNAIVTDTAKETAKSRAEEYANRKGGLTFENNNENLISARERDELQKFAERVGVEINVVKSLSKDASGKALMSRTGKKLVVNGKYQNGVITIASDAQNKLITVAKHELTHHLKETSPEMYQKLEDFVFERWYHGNAEEMEDEIARYTKLYSGQGLDRDGVREEIIADASEAFFTDEGAIQDAISFSEKLGRAIHDGIKTMLDAFLGLQDADSRRMRGYGGFLKDLGILQEAERMWLEALEDTQQRKRNARGNATAEDYVDASTQYTTSDEKHSLVESDDEIERLNSEPTQKSYRAMALIDGKLYPPMATRVKDENGKWVLQQGADIGQWIKSDITTDHRMFNSKGQFLLKKDNGGSPLEVAYNPYIHSSDVMLNDQFASAHKRPNIVVVEGEIPRSELENGKRAEHDLDDGRHIKAKDPTGTVQWKAGVVQSHLTGTRTVFLTNHFKPTRVVPDSEVARSIQKMVAGTDVVIPYNVVTPSLRQELQKLGVKMEQSKQKGYQVDLNAKYSVTPEEDQAYMDAVNKGDMKTAQRMVDEEAKKHGYDIKAYHGTLNEPFTRFKRPKNNDLMASPKGFIYASESRRYAEEYATYGTPDDPDYERGTIVRGFLKTGKTLDLGASVDGFAFDSSREELNDPKVTDKEANKSLRIVADSVNMSPSELLRYLGVKATDVGFVWNIVNSPKFAELVESLGYDSIHTIESGYSSYGVLNPEQIKSADPVTYDDDGDVIPLSERFNDSNEDIRYSVSEDRDYMQAVESNDTETAQRLVDERAKRNGWRPRHTYHGTLAYGFTVFDKKKAHVGGNSGAGFYFSTEMDDSINHYADIEGADNYFKREALADQIFEYISNSGEDYWEGHYVETYEDAEELAKELLNKNPDTYDVYLKYDKPYVRDYRKSTNIYDDIMEDFDPDDYIDRSDYDSDEDYEDDLWNYRSEYLYDEIYTAVYNAYTYLENMYDSVDMYDSIEDVANKIIESVYDYESLTWDDIHDAINSLHGIDIINDDWAQASEGGTEFTRAIIENLGYDAIEDKEVASKFGQLSREMMTDTEHIIVFHPNQIKSAEPITYDDNGKVVPLSKRFNEVSDDIRYSIADRDDIENLGANVTDGGSVAKFSVESWNETDVDELRQKLIDAGNDPNVVDKWIRDVNSMSANIIRNRLTYKADRTHSALKNNSEYYYTLDLSTLCAKRKLYQGTFNAIMHSEGMENVSLLPKDVIHLRALMDTMGYEVPCGICYEESRKKNEPKFAKQWLFGYKTKTTEWAGYANMEHDDPYIPTLADVLTTDGRSMLQAQHPEVLEAYLTFQKGRGSANPKVSRLHTDYRSDILNMTKGDIENVIKIGGLRIQSFSDFELPHVLDMMQAVLDMSVMGLTSQAYTKVPAFAQIFGNTGIKINLSLIGKAVDGKLVFDDKEGIDHRKAFKLRKKFDKNVGTILVGANRESILLAWADSRIDMVIPFHRSGWSKAEFKALGLGGYEDFQAYQSERYILDEEQARILTEKDKQNPKKKKPHTYKAGETVTLAMAHSNGFLESKDELYSNDYWDGNLSGKENAEKYLRLCAEQHRRPVFYEFLQDNGDGSWSLQPDGSTDGYWKSLIDFKMYDSTGKFAPQEVVKPTFNMQSANDIMQKFEGDPDNLPVADDVVKQFVKDYKGGRKYKLVNDKKIVDKNLPKIDTSKFSVSEETETPTTREYKSTISKIDSRVSDLKSDINKADLSRKTFDDSSAKVQAGRLLKRHDGNISIIKNVSDSMKKIADIYKAQGVSGIEDAEKIAQKTAVDIVNSIRAVHDEGADEYKAIKQRLRNTTITVSEDIRKEFPDYNKFRSRFFGRLKLTNGDTSNINEVYSQLMEMFPEQFTEDYTKPMDQLNHIADVMDNYVPYYEELDGASIEMQDYVADIASDIMETAYKIQTKKKFSTKEQESQAQKFKTAREDALKSRNIAVYKNTKAKYERKAEALRQRNKDFKEETRENAEKKRRLNQIAGIHKRLLEKLDTPKDTKHLPDGYAPLVSNVLSMFDFTTKGMEKWAERYGEPSKRYRYLDELRKRLADMSKEDSPIADSGFEIDPDIIEIIEELKADVADTDRLSDLDSATLEDIYTLFKAFEHQLNTFNKAFDENNKQTVIENRDNFISEVRDKKTRKDKQGTIGWLQRQLETNNTTPEDFFHLIGGTPEKLYKSIRKGFDKHILNVKSAMDFIQSVTEGKDVKKWSENVREYTTSFNETIKLTDAQLMSIYCLSKREQAQQHMYSENGGSGIVVVPQKVGKGLKAETLDRANVVVNSSDIQKWISQLSKEQIEVADQLQRYLSEDMSKLGNETSLKLYGYKKFTEKNYFPIQSSNDWLNSNFDFKGDSPVLKNTGMTKALNKHASNAIVIDDIFTVATKHISTMSLYNSLVPSLTDFQRFWNSKDKDHNTTVQKEFIRVYGEPAYKYVENFMGDLNGSYKRGFEVEGVDKLMSKYKQASIGLNLRVLFQQPTAVARAGAVMNPIYITKALGASTTTLKQNLKDMREHCPIALWKSWGFYNTDLARDMRSIMMNEKTFSDNFSKAYGIADDLTWSVIFKAVRYEVEAQNKNLKVGSDEYWEKVNERASEVFDRTQVVDSPFHRSQNMRAKDNLSKMVTAFMAEPTKTYNMLKTELTLAKREIQSGQKAQGVKRASRVVQVFVTNALLVSASSAVIDALRGVGGSGDDDKDKNWFERFLAHWWTNTKDNINPLGLLPVFKDVQSIVNGYDVTRMDMQSISRMIQSLQKMGEYIKSPEESKYTLANEVDYFAQQASYVVGIPYANFRRDARGIAFSIAEAVGYDDLFFEEAKFKYQMNETAKSKNQFVFMELYLDALNKGDTTLANKIKKYMTDNGVTEDYFKEKINADKKDNKSASQQHKFDSSIQTLESSPIWNSASEDNKEYYTGVLENLSVGIENQSTEYVTKLAKNGLTNEQVILYKLALKKVDKPNKNGKLGGTPTNAEKEDAIRLLERYYNLTQAQKDTLMGK